MNRKAGVFVFLAISLTAFLIMPAVNLWNKTSRTHAKTLLTQKDGQGLVKLIFQSDQIEAVLAAALWKAGISMNPDQVIIGRDGWLHLGDNYGKNISVKRGIDAISHQMIGEKIGSSLSHWNEWMQTRGVRSFVFMVGPDKASVYPQTLPKWAQPSQFYDPLESLINEAKSVILDLRSTLKTIASSADHRLYYTTDTHWNQVGAAHAFVLLGERLQDADSTLRWTLQAPVKIKTQLERDGGDLSLFLRSSRSIRDIEPIVDGGSALHNESIITDYETGEFISKNRGAGVDFPFKTVHVATPSAINQRRVLWLRDSFGGALSPWMASVFSETIQLHWKRGMKDNAQLLNQIISNWKPQLVIFTVVERDTHSALFQATPIAYTR